MEGFVNLIDTLRREMPEVTPDVWSKILRLASQHYGSTRVYVPASAKRSKLEALAAAQADADVSTLAAMLGVTPRRVRQLKQLCKKT